MGELKFTRQEDVFAAEYTSEGRALLQMDRVARGFVKVLYRLDVSLPWLTYTSFSVYEGACVSVMVNLPDGSFVRVESEKEVRKAFITTYSTGGGGGADISAIPSADIDALK